MKWVWILFAVCAMSASAADISGAWKGTIDGPNGPMENTFTFKVTGDKVTGTVSIGTMIMDSEISEGKIDGDNLSFIINAMGNSLTYKGKVTGDQIQFTLEVPGMGQSIAFTAKKTS